MPFIIIILCVLCGAVSSCDAAHALTIENAGDYDRKLDISLHEEIESYVCHYVDCNIPLHVDEVKFSGAQLAALHISWKIAL